MNALPPQLALFRTLEGLSQLARPAARAHLSRAQASALLPVLRALQGRETLPGPVAALVLRQVTAVLTPEQVGVLLGSGPRPAGPGGQEAGLRGAGFQGTGPQWAGPQMQGAPFGPMPAPPQGRPSPAQVPSMPSASVPAQAPATPSTPQGQLPPHDRQAAPKPQAAADRPQAQGQPQGARDDGRRGRETNPFFVSAAAQQLQHLIAELDRLTRTR